MRCLKCGYNNEPDAQVCVKCGNPLHGRSVQPDAMSTHTSLSRPTVLNVNQPEQLPRPTQLDTSIYAHKVNKSGDISSSLHSCPACGCQVVGNLSVCPSCGYPIVRVQQHETSAEVMQGAAVHPSAVSDIDLPMTLVCDKCGSEVSIANKFCPQCGERIHLTTMRVPRKKSMPLPQCSLTLIPEEDEQLEARSQQYEGMNILLNRDNTDPMNRTITSREQAVLSYEDGKWFIENKSDYGTTYIVANRKMELQSGDIVILGDRSFEFNADSEKK